MELLMIMAVCFGSSVIGSICGIGGGVIIKPVLDSVGIMEVTTASFLSGCTVLSMSAVSFFRNIGGERDYNFDKFFAGILTLGSVIGGVSGKAVFQNIVDGLDDKNAIGAIQAAILLIITAGTFIYTVNKKHVATRKIDSKSTVFFLGLMLGMMSSFLGIGGGPMNLIVLYYFFSMETKEAALYSICIILFSQLSALFSTLISGQTPEFSARILALMVGCGVFGGIAGTKINNRITNKTVDKLFVGLIVVIMLLSVYNIVRYA